MNLINKLSDSEKKLLFVLFTLIILVGSYKFGYLTYTDKADKLSDKNSTLSNQLKELEQKQVNKESYLKKTKEMNQEVETILNQFPAIYTPEKSTIFVTDLESYSDMKVQSIIFQDSIPFFSQNGLSETTDENANTQTASGTTDSIGTIDKNDTKNGTTSDENNNDFVAYKTAIVLTFQSTYDGMKKAIQYINDYKDKMNICDLTVAFDNSTGNLSGTMTINQYAITGYQKEYQPPNLEDVPIGVDNIFGTFETHK